jgi:hypothetical protein
MQLDGWSMDLVDDVETEDGPPDVSCSCCQTVLKVLRTQSSCRGVKANTAKQSKQGSNSIGQWQTTPKIFGPT